AEVNRTNGFESLFLMTTGDVAHVSSSIVRQAMAAGLSLDGLVSPRVDEALREWQAGQDV
ncbi:MAG: pantetheine-phosphate adenylyltransferase, partial [Planctomycetota bacterium]